MPIRILITEAQDHAIARAGLQLVLQDLPQVEVIGDAGNCEDALRCALHDQPDIILFDLIQGSEAEFSLLAQLLEAGSHARIIVLTGLQQPHIHQSVVRLGALGIVSKQQSLQVLLKAIECVHAGEIWLERTMAASALTALSRTKVVAETEFSRRIATLTEREREVIELVGEGLKNRAIAERLFVTEAAVRHRLTSIFEKLQLSDRLELVVFAYQHGLCKLPR